jgi:hypothetical protein
MNKRFLQHDANYILWIINYTRNHTLTHKFLQEKLLTKFTETL